MVLWGITALVALGAGWFLFARGEGGVGLLDPDCEPGVPAMAVALYGDIRQDDIAVVDETGDVTRLTNDHASIEPSFSPDGEQIVFTSGREGEHAECCGFSDQEIYVMDSDGSEQRRLMPDGDHFDSDPAWSPDGELIAFARRGEGVMTVSPEGGEPTAFYETDLEVDSIEWRPGGDHLVFEVAEDVMIIGRDGSDPEVFIDDAGYNLGMSWTPDGKTLAFSETYAIYTATLDDRDPRLLLRGGHVPAWSPTGGRLAYLSAEDDPRVMVVPAEGGDPSPLPVERKNLSAFEPALEWLDC